MPASVQEAAAGAQSVNDNTAQVTRSVAQIEAAAEEVRGATDNLTGKPTRLSHHVGGFLGRIRAIQSDLRRRGAPTERARKLPKILVEMNTTIAAD